MVRAFFLACLVGLSGCVGVEKVAQIHAFCVVPIEYTAAQQQKAASELVSLGSDSELAQFIIDYAKQRAAERECLKHS